MLRDNGVLDVLRFRRPESIDMHMPRTVSPTDVRAHETNRVLKWYSALGSARVPHEVAQGRDSTSNQRLFNWDSAMACCVSAGSPPLHSDD